MVRKKKKLTLFIVKTERGFKAVFVPGINPEPPPCKKVLFDIFDEGKKISQMHSDLTKRAKKLVDENNFGFVENLHLGA